MQGAPGLLLLETWDAVILIGAPSAVHPFDLAILINTARASSEQ